MHLFQKRNVVAGCIGGSGVIGVGSEAVGYLSYLPKETVDRGAVAVHRCIGAGHARSLAELEELGRSLKYAGYRVGQSLQEGKRDSNQ